MSRAMNELAADLKKTEKLSDDWFGSEGASFEGLTSVRRSRRARKNTFIDRETVDVLE